MTGRQFLVWLMVAVGLLITACTSNSPIPLARSPEPADALHSSTVSSSELAPLWNQAINLGLASWVSESAISTGYGTAEGVRGANGRLMAARVKLPTGDVLGWTHVNTDHPSFILLLEASEQAGVSSRTFVNLRTGAARSFDPGYLHLPEDSSRLGVREFVAFPDDPGYACGYASGGVGLAPSALDPECYDDCMRGSQHVCAADCALALLLGGPPAYIACFGACMGIWYTTCRLGCDF